MDFDFDTALGGSGGGQAAQRLENPARYSRRLSVGGRGSSACPRLAQGIR
jgi:hypothetical protein